MLKNLQPINYKTQRPELLKYYALGKLYYKGYCNKDKYGYWIENWMLSKPKIISFYIK